MGDFMAAQGVLGRFEGGYANNPSDRGGETYAGIARSYWPHWAGWEIVDEAKKLAGFPRNLADLPDLRAHVDQFYKVAFWDALHCDEWPQQLAVELYEQAVNRGVNAAVMDLQKVCNALNFSAATKGPLFEDLPITGNFRELTKAAVNALMDNRGLDHLVMAMNRMQGAAYINIAATNRTQRQFTRGWLRRTKDGLE